jgi:LacI family transcriptional regulator
MAAHFFIKRMFCNFAYFGMKDVIWSDERGEGYSQEIKHIGGNYFSFESDKSEDEIRDSVYKWLKELPKPIAIFCCDDVHALFISEICKISNINIPEDISLLGVDNDDLICNISDPSISSIELEVEKGGYAVGRRIHQLIKKEQEGPFNIAIKPIRIELRQSTEKYNIRDPYISEMVKYIESHYKSELSIETLSVQYPLSRRNLEIRFKNALNTSIYQFILSCKIDHLADMLITSDRSLIDLAIEVGFKDYNNISRIFKKFKGCSPLEYRQRKTIDR